MRLRNRNIVGIAVGIALWIFGCGSSRPKPNPELEKLPRVSFSTPSGSFGMGIPEGMVVLSPDSVQWSSIIVRPEGNKSLGYFYPRVSEADLVTTHVAMEYMAKSLPGCANRDSIFAWLKKIHINPDRQGRLVDESKEIATLDGQIVKILEIATPPVQVMGDTSMQTLGGKRLAWAYIDHKDYYIGLNLSATDSTQYPHGLEQFQQIIGSYRPE